MLVNENLVQEIVQEVVAKMQIEDDVQKSHGVFADMNDAIAAAKKAQAVVRRMSLDQREQIITNIRRKTRENAEVLARMGVNETGMGNVGHKILTLPQKDGKITAQQIEKVAADFAACGIKEHILEIFCHTFPFS